MLCVLDTNVLSELMRATPDAGVRNWFTKHPEHTFATSTICQAEIIAGFSNLPKGKKKQQLFEAAQYLWQSELAGLIFPFDRAAADFLQDIFETRRAKGMPIQLPDALIAATCLAHKACIVTRDVSGFMHIGLQVVNPWQD